MTGDSFRLAWSCLAQAEAAVANKDEQQWASIYVQFCQGGHDGPFHCLAHGVL